MAAKEYRTSLIFITNPPDINYLCGCREGAGALLIGEGWAVIFTNKMFREVIAEQAPGVELCVPETNLYDAAKKILRRKKERTAIGFQGGHITWAQHRTFSDSMGKQKKISIADSVVTYRAVKDEEEIRLTRRCVTIAEDAFRELTNRGLSFFIGKSEKAIATELEYLMRQCGADRQGFPLTGTIVASGANSASCHHMPTDRTIRLNEPLLIDWGAELSGYRSDITRTLFTGSVPGRFEEIYNTVLHAHNTGVEAVRPGVHCHTVARKGWGVIRDAGHGETIRHGLGHGIGLEIHERPGMGNGITPKGAKSPVLKKGMIITIEPGIYYKGEGGVRIEDDILVTSSGYKRLNALPRKLEDVIITS